jgi:hypothetical protein
VRARLQITAVLAIAFAVSTSPALAATRFLVAVGNGVGLADEEPLRFAQLDAERFRDVFVDLGAVSGARASVITDGGIHALELALARLHGQVEEAVRLGERVDVLFYLSSHGDAESVHLDGERYPLATLEQRLKQLPATATLLVLDSCRVRITSSDRDKGAVRGPAFDVTVQRELAPQGFVTLYAARDGEAAQESDALQGAYFTHHLVVGLRGAADFDADKKVTLAEAWRHAHQTTLARSHATASAQHPEMNQALTGEAELVLVDLARADATLRVPAHVQGALLLLDVQSGRVLFEVDKAAGRAFDIAMPARLVRAQLRASARPDVVQIGDVDLRLGGQHTLDDAALTEQPLVVAMNKGLAHDLTPWIASASAGAQWSPFGLPWGGVDVTFGRRVLQTPVFVRARVSGARSELASKVRGVGWRYINHAASAAVGAEAEARLSDVRVAAALDAGVAWQQQEGVRDDAERLRALGLSPPEVSGWALGPRGALEVNIQVPVVFGLALLGGARAGASVFAVEQEPTVVPDGAVFFGGAFEW